jgi:signal transduction histidine kinase
VVSRRGGKPTEDRPPTAVDPRGPPIDPREAQAGAIVHDINNLLTAILGHAQLALGEPGLPSAARADLGDVVRASRRAALLTRQLVAIGRPPRPERTTVDLRTIVGATARMLRPLLGPDIELVTEAGSRRLAVEADPADLEGIVLNLAINARDAMPDGGTLTLSTRAHRDGDRRAAAVTIADSGVGMDAATQARAFEPYFTTKEPGHGSGLGLTSVVATVARCGWTLVVDSSVGIGSRFTVVLPLAPRTPSRTPTRSVSPPLGILA